MSIKNFGEACKRIFESVKTLTGDVAVSTDGSLQEQISALITGTKTANKATKWSTARNINGMTIDGTTNRANYGTCSTAAATAAKTVACTGFALVTGAEITIKFTVTNTAANPTLNVNNTGAKPIYYRGSAISAGYLAANRTYTFRYNGSQYELVGDIDTKVTVDSALSGTSTNPVQNKIIKAFLDAIIDGSKTVGLANSLVSNNTFAKDETIESWVLATNNFAIKFVVSANGYPSDAPIQQEGFYILLEQASGLRKKVIFIPYANGIVPYEKRYFNNAVFENWAKMKSGVAETLSGLTASIDELNYCDGLTQNVQTHFNSKNNPHGVTASQTGAELLNRVSFSPSTYSTLESWVKANINSQRTILSAQWNGYNTSDCPFTNWGMIYAFGYSTDNGIMAIYKPNTGANFYCRTLLGSGWLEDNWIKFCTEKDLANYLPLTGGTLNGTVSIQATNGGCDALLIGDDCYLGDVDIANALGIQGKSDKTKGFVAFGTGKATFGYDGSKLTCGKTLNAPTYQQNGVAGNLVSISSSAPSNTSMLWAY